MIKFVGIFCSYEDLLMESSDEEEEEEEQRKSKKKRATKISTSKDSRRKRPGKDGDRGQAWIKEGDGDEPINFLDPRVTQRVSGWLELYVVLPNMISMLDTCIHLDNITCMSHVCHGCKGCMALIALKLKGTSQRAEVM